MGENSAEGFGRTTKGTAAVADAARTVQEPRAHRVPAGAFRMGSALFYDDERPVHEVEVASFAMDVVPVTTDEFARFVRATGYLTTAERPLPAEQFPGLDEEGRMPGSLVFTGTPGPVDLGDWRSWWSWMPGASWRHPLGPGSDLAGKGDHPVVQVSHADCASYAEWAGRRLPTEAEWEYAARGGLDGQPYAWGSEVRPGGRLMANTWQGSFPYLNTGAEGWRGTSPAGAFPPNGYGLFDLIGNVWEWTSTEYRPQHRTSAPSCCTVDSPASGRGAERLVLKGGSHLCAPEYCLRYRPAARSPQTPDTATSHIGFRCVTD